MAKALEYADGSGYLVMCPACGNGHKFDKGRWTFSGTLDRPTFAPSMLVRGHLGGEQYGVCHSFVRDGRIEFLADCTHSLRGQTVDLPDVPEHKAAEE